jgi:hypothetical protein
MRPKCSWAAADDDDELGSSRHGFEDGVATLGVALLRACEMPHHRCQPDGMNRLLRTMHRGDGDLEGFTSSPMTA